MIPTPAAPLFEAATPREQEGRPSQPERSPEEVSVRGRHPSVSADKAAGDFLTPTEVHRGETLAADHGAISGNRAVGFTYPTRGNA